MLEEALTEGAVAIDATMGNGHDTLWLCQRVGATGRVYGFDVQQDAVDRTAARLTENGVMDRATLFCAGHETMAEHVPEQADVIVFNLGWLPGAAHGVTTQTETTLKAVNAALTLLKPAALLTICVYPGHEEGTREWHALLEFCKHLDPMRFDCMLKTYMNQPNDPPRLFAIRKRP